VIPVVRRVLADELSAVGVYRQLAHGNFGSFILESAEHGGSWGRWSFVGASSTGAIIARDGHAQWIGSHPEGALEEGTFLEVVHSALEELATLAPGNSVEVRVPPYGVTQCIAGPRHTRGTPPSVVETSGFIWCALAAGALAWDDASASGLLTASGERSNLSRYFPLF